LKRLAAILLLALFVFNTVGYRLLFDVLETNTDAAFTAKLDDGKYNNEDLITIKSAYQYALPGKPFRF
jgi:hypothetical protein